MISANPPTEKVLNWVKTIYDGRLASWTGILWVLSLTGKCLHPSRAHRESWCE
jgi:hypothetical protein